MAARDDIIGEIQRRIYLVDGIGLVEVNPRVPPDPAVYPAVSVIVGDDFVDSASATGDYPILKRILRITTIPYLIGSDGTDPTAEAEIVTFSDNVKKEIYRDKANLSGTCSLILEKRTHPLIKPHVGEPGIGLPLEWEIRYEERIEELF